MKRDWTSRAGLLMIGLILMVINLIGLNLFFRLDLTDDRVYSLSNASIDLVEQLEDPVTLTAYFTEDLPAPYAQNRRFLRDKLDDYRAYGGANVQYRFVDPGSNDELRQEAGRMNIPPVQIQVVEEDNVQLRNAYMGLAIQYGGEHETIPVVQDLSTLEYDITSAIRSLTRDELPSVGFLTGHGEPSPFQDLRTLAEELRRNYDVLTVNVEDSTLSDTPDVLMVVAPADSLGDGGLRAIDDYVMGGGRVAFLLNAVDANLQMGQARPLSVGLEPLLTAYGAGLRSDLVMDEQSSAVTVQRQQGFFNLAQQIQYAFLPIATNFSRDNLMVSRLDAVMFYFASSVDTSVAVPEGVRFEPLAFSSRRSDVQEGYFMIQPMQQQQPDLSGGPFVLAAAYRGTFPSAFTTGATSPPTRMVLVGDGDFLNESIVGQIPGNIRFGLNMVDWLAQDDALLTIRAKDVEPRRLPEVSEGLRPWIKYGNMLLPVLIVCLIGLWRWRRIRARDVVLVHDGRDRGATNPGHTRQTLPAEHAERTTPPDRKTSPAEQS